MIIYQKRLLRNPATERLELIRPQASLTPDELDIFYCSAKDADSVVGFFEGN